MTAQRRPGLAHPVAKSGPALVDGFTNAFIAGTVIAALGILASLTLIRPRELESAPEAEPALDLAA